jgi:glycosyltransferase involved in cell wall biosynthesis
MTRITIAIPSYNRVSVLQNNLGQVATSLPSWVQLLVVDNASVPVVELGPELEGTLNELNIPWRVSRNRSNIGGGANIVRCFEEVETDWFLLCGDDDVIDPAALQMAYDLIKRHPDAAFIKCSSRFHRYDDTFFGKGTVQLLESARDYGGLLFMSSFLFNRKLCMPYLRFGYLATAAYAPQVAIALLASKTHPFVLSPLIVARANESDPAWSPVDVMLSAYQLADLPLDRSERASLLQLIYRAHNIGRELLDIVTILRTPSQRAEGLFLRRKAIRNHMFHGSGIKRLTAIFCLFFSPYLGSWGQRFLIWAYLYRTGRSSIRIFRDRHAGL